MREVLIVELPQFLKAWLREYAAENGVTMSEVIKLLLIREQEHSQRLPKNGQRLFRRTS